MVVSPQAQKILVASTLLVGLSAIGFFWWRTNPPRVLVTVVSPKAGEQAAALDLTGRVEFDRPVRPAEVSLQVLPSKELSLTWGDGGRSLEFSFQTPLTPETTYQLSLVGRGLDQTVWSFTTRSEATSGVGSDEVGAAYAKYLAENPLVGEFPVVTEDYRITRLGGRRFEVTIYAADQGAAKTAVLAWFGERGVDPSTIELVWVE